MRIDKRQYITIAEFAKRAGVSRQTVYNRLDKDLTEFVKVIDNRKHIDKTALSMFSAENQNNSDHNETSSNDDVSNVSNNNDNLTKKLIDSLTAELEIKNKQIETLMRQNETLTDVLRLTQEQLSASQALHAGTLQAQLQSNDDTVIEAEQESKELDIPPEPAPEPEIETVHPHEREKQETKILNRLRKLFR